jgi:hypothetical protein
VSSLFFHFFSLFSFFFFISYSPKLFPLSQAASVATCGWQIVTGEPILPVIARASELALAFGTHPMAVKRSDPRNAL